MNKLTKLTSAALATTIIAASSFAQDGKESAKPNRNEEIIIQKKDGKAEKMTIVVDGDNVTINGKPADEFRNSGVTILRRARPAIASVPRVRAFRGPNNLPNFEEFDRMIPVEGNKAALGVLTQKAEDGVKVTGVTKESSAEKAGIKKDDVITKVGNATITTPQDLMKAIGEYKPNDKVDITYKRGGKENRLSVTLSENKSRPFAFNMNEHDFNFDFNNDNFGPNGNFTFNRRPKIGLQIQDVEEGKGVTVKDVDDESPAAKAGIKEGDLITQVNGKDVAGVDELRIEIKDAKEGDTLKFSYSREGKNQVATIKLPKRLKSADL